MGWSWRDLHDTPEYVRQYSWDLMQARMSAQNQANERAERQAPHA
jgi:hypothetical protein